MRFLFVIIIAFHASVAYSQSNPTIDVSKFHEFDFWIGEWTVYKYGTDTIAGYSKIETIIDGIGLLENYHIPNGQYSGKSLNKYNVATGQWEQYWIDNSGLTLHLTGGLQNGIMVMDDVTHGDKSQGLNRIEWSTEGINDVRQKWSTSSDGGTTWNVVFDGIYKRKQSTHSDHPLMGSWEFSSIDWIYADTTYSIATAQPGIFTLTEDHYTIMWTPTRSPRAPFSILSKPTDAETIAGFRSVVFNGGTYELSDDRLTTTALIAKVPGFEGGTQYYRYNIDGDKLELTMYDETYPDGTKPEWFGSMETKFTLKRKGSN